MAVVYRAQDAILGREVAVKVLHKQYAESSISRLRFHQEARAMASLDHENIVRVYDISRDGQVPFIVAECVDGRDLGSLLIRGRRLGEQFTRKVAVQLLEALSYAHRQGVIHRDIKPSNILINHRGVVKVADFGIARLMEGDEAGEPGEIIGSASYMSPEQLTGDEVSPRSDIYSAGILLYNCLTGTPPFTGDLKSLARQQLRAEPQPIRESNKGVSPHMEAVVMKALAKNPLERYSSANAMLKDLYTEEDSLVEPPTRKGRGLLVAAALAVTLLLAGGGALATGKYMDGAREQGAGATVQDVADNSPTEARPVESEPPQSPDSSEAPEARPIEGESSQTPEPPAPGGPVAAAAGDSASAREPAPQPASYAVVPDVRAYFDFAANRILTERGFEVSIVYDEKYGYASRGVAWATDPAIGTRVPAGSTITLYSTPDRHE